MTTQTHIAGYGRPIESYLPDDYLPPYCTPLGPRAFQQTSDPMRPGWTVTALDEHGQTVRYMIELRSPNGDRVIATVDGKPVRGRDIATRLQFESGAVSQWYDWILATDAEARMNNAQPQWKGDDLASSVHCLEHGVVHYDTQDENTANFAHTSELQHWLDDVLAGTSISVLVLRLDRLDSWELVDDSPQVTALGRRHWHPECVPPIGPWLDDSSATVTYLPVKFDPGLDADCWWSVYANSYSPWIRLSTSGRQITGYCAEGFVPLTTLETIADVSTDDDGVRGSWWSIRVVGTDLVLVFPANDTMLTVETDYDGAAVKLTARNAITRAVFNAVKDHFSRIWGKWLDPDSHLTDEELAGGINKAEQMLEEAE